MISIPAAPFARKIISHDQGGLEMARVVLKHSQDAEIKRQAQMLIDEQNTERAKLEDWLRWHGGQSVDGTARDGPVKVSFSGAREGYVAAHA